MRISSPVRVAVLAATGFACVLAQQVRAQDAGNVRVVRLSQAEGQVLVSHAGTNVWDDAPPNYPLEEGDTLATQAGRAEIEFENGATAYLAENTVLQFTQLGFSGAGRATDLTLTQGTGTFYANLASQDTFRVEANTFNVTIPERAEFRLDGFLDGAAVQVFTGDVSVTTARGSTRLEKGQSVAVHEKDFQDLTIGSLPTAEDAFDQWVTQQGEMIRAGNANTLTYVNSPNSYGLSDLSRYGTWVNVAGFGFSWRPFSVGFTWTPYFNGHWIFNPQLGWIWVSGEPWGWMPYHFGSWLLAPNLGWIWVPGGPTGLRQWEASRVNWVSVGNQVGWVAKSPNDREGAPANATRGIIVKSGHSPGSGFEPNEVLSGKDARIVTPVKQPPAEFASRLTPGVPHEGPQSTLRRAPRGPESNNPSIVYDQGTRAYVNRDAANDRQPGKAALPPVPAPPLMPKYPVQTEVPRGTPPPSGQRDSGPNRVLLPPPYRAPVSSPGNVPANGALPPRAPISGPLNGTLPARPPVNAPPNTQPHPSVPIPAAPRPAVAPPAAPPAPRPAPAPAGSTARPAGQTPQAGAPAAPADRRN